ncbi:MAG: hypothetical protein KY469_22350 [Actinobacteria bacterium]|nr:hypothetical protein [Actinomycetota bacterium]
MSYRIAESLDQIRDEVNAFRPGRDKLSDGWIGDPDHASRSSDHNPWVKDSRGQGVVTAFDADEDHDQHIGNLVLAATVGRRDRRVKFVIYERKIWRSYKNHSGHPAPWTPEPYTGPNAHAQHIHVSVLPDPRLYDDRSPWGIAGVVRDLDQKGTHMRRGDSGGRVLASQARLNWWRGEKLTQDGATGRPSRRRSSASRSTRG